MKVTAVGLWILGGLFLLGGIRQHLRGKDLPKSAAAANAATSTSGVATTSRRQSSGEQLDTNPVAAVAPNPLLPFMLAGACDVLGFVLFLVA